MLLFAFQVLLSSDDLKMMMEDVTYGYSTQIDSDSDKAVVNLRTFLLIMEYSSW
jgi:hypothetical protein